MNLFPKRIDIQSKSDDGLGRGMEFAILVAAFLGAGYGLDRWLGTKPLFMIVLVVLALVGQFASMWYGYGARMQALEAERLATRHAGPRSAAPADEPEARTHVEGIAL